MPRCISLGLDRISIKGQKLTEKRCFTVFLGKGQMNYEEILTLTFFTHKLT